MRVNGKKKSISSARLKRIDSARKYYLAGYSRRQIKKSVMSELKLTSYSLQTVQNDIDYMLELWREDVITDMGDLKSIELAKCDMISREAMISWHSSKKTNKFGVGNPEYLNVVNTQNVERRKMLGLYAAKQVEFKTEQPLFPDVDLILEDVSKNDSDQ